MKRSHTFDHSQPYVQDRDLKLGLAIKHFDKDKKLRKSETVDHSTPALDDLDLKLNLSIKHFERTGSLRKTETVDRSSPLLESLKLPLSIKHFDTGTLKHVEPMDKSSPMYVYSLTRSYSCFHDYDDTPGEQESFGEIDRTLGLEEKDRTFREENTFENKGDYDGREMERTGSSSDEVFETLEENSEPVGTCDESALKEVLNEIMTDDFVKSDSASAVETIKEKVKSDIVETNEEKVKLNCVETIEEKMKSDSAEATKNIMKSDTIETTEEKVKLDNVETKKDNRKSDDADTTTEGKVISDNANATEIVEEEVKLNSSSVTEKMEYKELGEDGKTDCDIGKPIFANTCDNSETCTLVTNSGTKTGGEIDQDNIEIDSNSQVCAKNKESEEKTKVIKREIECDQN